MVKRIIFAAMALLLAVMSVSCKLDGKPIDEGNKPVSTPSINATDEPDVPTEPQYESLYNGFMSAERYYVRYRQTVLGFTTAVEMAVDGDNTEVHQTSGENKLHTLTLDGIKYTINDSERAYTKSPAVGGTDSEATQAPADDEETDGIAYNGSGSANINGEDCVYDEYGYSDDLRDYSIRYYIHKAENRLYAIVTTISDFSTTMLIEEYRENYSPEGWFVLPEGYAEMTQEEFDALYAG